MAEALNELDRRIVAALAKDGRRSYRDIARELGVSEATVRSRATRLQNQGLIKVTAVGSPLALGVKVVALILMRIAPGKVAAAERTLASYPHIRFVATALGSADIVIQTLHPSVRDLHRFVSEELPAVLPELNSTETFQLTKVLKSTWTWGDWFEYLEGAEDEQKPDAEASYWLDEADGPKRRRPE